MQQAVVQQTSPYSDHFRARRKERLGEPVWLIERRTAAIEAFEAQGFPTRRSEAWRNLDLGPVVGADFPTVHVAGDADQLVDRLKQAIPDASWLVFFDGHFSSVHSDTSSLPAGITVRPLSQALDQLEAVLDAHLGEYVTVESHAFAALNTALFEDGAVVHVARGAVADRPVAIAYLNSEENDGRAVYPRTLIVAEEQAQVSVAEFHQGADVAGLCCPVTEIAVAANAVVRYHQVQEQGGKAYHFGVVGSRLQRDARLSAHFFATGGKLARTEVFTGLAGIGAEAELDGLYLVSEGQYIDHHTWVSHLREHGSSRQLFKGVLTGKSEAVFDGLVKVAKGAQKTDARQENRNLLLSKRALAHSNPRLEIFADDVKCSHGSSVGELDPDALFYLRSRGIGPEEAQGLMTYAFVGEVLDTVSIEPLREYERAAALRYLPGDQTVKDVL